MFFEKNSIVNYKIVSLITLQVRVNAMSSREHVSRGYQRSAYYSKRKQNIYVKNYKVIFNIIQTF